MIVAMKMKTAPGMFMSAWLIGEAVAVTGENSRLKDACTFYEAMNQQGQLMHNYVTDHMVTEEIITVKNSDFSTTREVSESSKVYEQYQKALAGFRAEKAGLVVPGNRPLSPAPSPGMN